MLKISKLTDYGLLASVYLARRQGETVSSREVAEFCHLPLPVVSKVLKILLEGGVIQSYRGAGGGYSLVADPESITLATLLEVLEGPWELVECETVDDDGHAVCGIRQGCPSRSFMFGINRTIKNAFDMVTLGDLLRGGRPKLEVAHIERVAERPTV
jgi:FeS assembly SUF system regulator